MIMYLIRVVDYYVGIPLCFFIGMADKFVNIFRRKQNDAFEPKKILLIKTWGAGNIVLMLPAMRGIREKYPKAKIYFLSLAGNRGLLDNDPYIDDYFFIDMKSLKAFVSTVARNIMILRQKNIDYVLDFDQFARFTALLSFLIGKKRFGFDTRGQGKRFVFTDSVVYNNTQHMSMTFYELAKAAGAAAHGYRITKVPYSSKDSLFIEEFFKKNNISAKKDIIIGMHVGCGSNFPSRRWPTLKFAQLADRLITDYGARIYFSGTKDEKPLIEETMRMMKNKAIDISGCLTIKQLSALIEKTNIFFVSDTGPLHIASAMGTPVVGFFGPNTPLLYGPLGGNNAVFYKGLPCSPCITNYNAKTSHCKDPVCIGSIEVDEVYNEVSEKILNKIIKQKDEASFLFNK